MRTAFQRQVAANQMLQVVIVLPLGGALRLESPCKVNRFLARAERSRLRLVAESARRKREVRQEGSNLATYGESKGQRVREWEERERGDS